MTQLSIINDGRRLAVEEWGDPRGQPVFLFHGTPGSRLGPHPRGSVLYRHGIRLLAYDRPGYGGSERAFGRTVADAADDVSTIADTLGIERFSVVGRSGGGPHALACAALMPERVLRVSVLAALAPRDAPGLDWLNGMTRANREDYAVAESGLGPLAEEYASRAAAARLNPASMMVHLDPHLPEVDRKVVSDSGIKAMLESNFVEAFRGGPGGWIDDTLAFLAPWGFDLDQIKARVRLWHGPEDVFAPISHSRWLASRIRNAMLIAPRGAAHFSAVTELPQEISWVAAGGILALE